MTNPHENYSDHEHPAPAYEAGGIPTDYADFVLGELACGKVAEDIPGFIGEGGDKMAFLVEQPGEEPRVLKVIKRAEYEPDMVGPDQAAKVRDKTLASVAPLEIGAGVDHLEQLVAADPDRGLMVTTYFPGKMISHLSNLELMGIRQDHLTELATTLQAMRERGLHPHNTGGIIFDKDTGFNFADYETEDDFKFNRGSIATLEQFLHFALSDFKKLDDLARRKMEGEPVPADKFKTTGLRALLRFAIIKRAQKLTQS